MTVENNGALSAAEEAYFSSGGETEITTDPALAPDAQQQQPDANAAPDALEVQDQSQVRDEKGRFVPHQALHAEREEHKKTKSELEQIRQQQAILNDRWNTLLAASKQPEQQQQPETPPDPNEDLFGYIKWQGDQVAALKAQTEEQRKAEQQAREQTEQEQQLTTFWASSVQEYASKTPEFTDAANWLSEYRHKQLEALATIDPNMATPAARNAQIDAETKAIINMARQRGQNPAELIHQLAKGWGFQPKAPAANGLNDKIAQIDAAQNASRTLAASPGRNSGDPLSPEAIASMSNAEFEAWMKVPENARRFQTMMGG